MVDGKCMSTSPHSICHEMLRFGIDHTVFFRDEKPGRVDLHAGFGAGSWMHLSAIGRCTALDTAI